MAAIIDYKASYKKRKMIEIDDIKEKAEEPIVLPKCKKSLLGKHKWMNEYRQQHWGQTLTNNIICDYCGLYDDSKLEVSK
jgi:hypothetical protein